MGEQDNYIHFIGIGGTGMSGLAKIMLACGYRVAGSDLKESSVTNKLAELGATIFQGHHTRNLAAGVNLVVVSSAIPFDNPEIQAAQARSIPIIPRGELLARLMQRQKGIAVAGTHGKTTTTSMISLVLERNHFDPTVIVGGEFPEFKGNAKWGKGEFLVAEADESDGSFLRLRPFIEVVTNIENDHLDYYGSMHRMIDAFKQFINFVPAQGFKILCTDNPYVAQICQENKANALTYGLQGNPDYQLRALSFKGSHSWAEVWCQNSLLGKLVLRVPGKHNLCNALAAVAVGHQLGIKFVDIQRALHAFSGVARRFQLLGQVAGVWVVDDYAHHPTEVKATLEAARQTAPGRVIAIFQPHRYTRTKLLHAQFGPALAGADLMIITGIYPAGEKPLPAVDAGLIVEAAREYYPQNLYYFPDKEKVIPFIKPQLRPGDLVITLGAGDIRQVGWALVQSLNSMPPVWDYGRYFQSNC